MAVRDVDLGFKAIVKELTKLDGKEVVAGVLRTAGKSADKKTNLVDIAIWNEYGTRRIPSRPFLRIAAEKNDWAKLAQQVGGRVIDGTMAAEQGLDLIGNKMVGDIQQVIGNRSLLAPNAPATVRRKGSDAPLIDTGQLRQAISFEVR